MSYTQSLLDTNYTVVSRRKVVEDARISLRRLLQDSSIKSTFDSERSLLNNSLNVVDEYLLKIENTLENESININDLPSGSLTDDDIEDFLEEENSTARFINNLTSGLFGISTILTDVISSTGILPSDYKNFTRNSILVSSLILFVIPGTKGLAATITIVGIAKVIIEALLEESLGDTVVNAWKNSISPFITGVKNSIVETTSRIYNSYIVPVVDTVVDYFQTGQAIDDYNSFLEIINDKSKSILINGLPATIFNIVTQEGAELGLGLFNIAGNIVSGVYNGIKNLGISNETGVTNFLNNAEDSVRKAGSSVIEWISGFINSAEVKNTLAAIGDFIGALLPNYKNGVTETRYGRLMEQSWTIFTASIQNDPNFNVNFLTTTPLDPSENTNFTIYGNMMLGAPLMYTRQTDPNNRTMINTFVKDSIFLSLTPGMPKYNGGAFQQELVSGFQSSYLTQTQTGEEMRDYLLKNGIDQSFANKDKRYYTFDANYEEYYAYLETMLNTMWIKMGLSATEDEKFNIFSFFTGTQTTSLQPKYKSSIGFYVNPVGDISEAISNTTFSSGLEGDANARSSEFQQLNFITGMGTAGPARNINRQIGIAGMQISTFKDIMRSNLSTGLDGAGNANSIISWAGAYNLVKSVVNFANTKDISSIVQQFDVTNGMKVQYPQLWESSNYSKNMNFTFNFVSPYGDPLSIFQYVYVPFFSLLAMAMPRQAAENGLVSPFFVRADIPGWITSDLALITDVTWQKGGSDGTLWTKDKLPRAISGSFTVTDLYPYLSSVKRLSFLSANPSFTVFLDNMAGLRALYNETQDDPFLEYWDNLINRVNGQRNTNDELWNRFSQDRKTVNDIYARTVKDSQTRSINKKAMPWLSRI
jgi:hypothetical protein